jgi:phosphatidylglycerophosphatase C
MSDAAPPSPDASLPPRIEVDAILARLDAELARLGGGVLATDADGTIWDGDVGVDSFERLLAEGAVRDEALPALAVDAAELGLSTSGKSPTELAAELYKAHLDERYPHDRAFAMMAWAFAGWRDDEVRAFAERVLDEGGLEARVRPEMRQILRWAEAQRVPVYVVSASPVRVVEAGVSRIGAPVARTLAMTPALGEGSVILPRLAGPAVYGDGKVRVLLGAGLPGPVLGAFGDSHYDAPMLREACVPVAVTPSTRLAALLHSIPGVVELARGPKKH